MKKVIPDSVMQLDVNNKRIKVNENFKISLNKTINSN